MNVPKSFTARMAEQFRREGQSLQSFQQELKALGPSDRAWYHEELNKAGLPTDPPA